MTFNDVELARQKYHQKTKKSWLIVFAISAVIITFIGILQATQGYQSQFLGNILSIPFCFIFISFIIIKLTTSKDAAAYHRAYKAYFVEQNLRATFTDLNYTHDAGLDPSILRATGMIKTGTRYYSNDLATARYKDVLFTQADANIEVEYTSPDGDTTYVTIFKGRFMIFEFPKKFNFKLELIGRRFCAYNIPGKNPKTGRKMTKINTESSEFNKAFKILAEDGFEVFYLLDPAIMIKIEDIAHRYKGRVLLGFVENKLLIAISDGKDSFEPPKASRAINEQAEIEKIHQDIKVITDFVDDLNLDHKFFN